MTEAIRAYVLIQTTVGAGHVAGEVRAIDGVESAQDVSGPYDVVATVTAPDMDALGRLVVARIQAVEGITRTLTCPIVQL